MKIKEITPGMVIHCPTKEDAMTLLEHLKEIGYDADWMLGEEIEDDMYISVRSYTEGRDGEYYAVIERRCRVKEDE